MHLVEEAFRITSGVADAPLVLTCEHASAAVPARYDALGLARAQLAEHVAWDIGAAAVAQFVAQAFGAPLVESAYSRLVIDCNRDLTDHDLIVAESHGVVVPGNRDVDAVERARRIETYHRPYHHAIDTVLAGRAARTILLSMHSFTPELRGERRAFDVGVLYDDYHEVAARLAEGLEATGFTVRHNEPYSAFDGLIFSARTHGRRHGLRYVELEINNALIGDAAGVGAVGRRLVRALHALLP